MEEFVAMLIAGGVWLSYFLLLNVVHCPFWLSLLAAAPMGLILAFILLYIYAMARSALALLFPPDSRGRELLSSSGSCTLGDALITAAIPTVILLILTPIFSRARETARQSSCASNLKQIGGAMLNYADDYDGRLPQAKKWCDQLLPFIKYKETFQCPSLSGVTGGYAFNQCLSGQRITVTPQGYVSTSPSLPALFDALGGWNRSGGINLAQPRHRDKSNVGFLDGSVHHLDMVGLRSLKWK